MKANIKTMQDLAAIFPDIYRKHKLLCHAQKKAGSVVITIIDKHNNSFQVAGGTIDKAYENLIYLVANHETIFTTKGDNHAKIETIQ